MADRRLLSREQKLAGLLIAAVLIMSFSGCIVGAGWSLDEIEGIVVDKTTGEPVAGAEVFAVLAKNPGVIRGGHWAPFNTRWATSDANGRFYIPAATQPYVEETLTWGKVPYDTNMYVFRRGYGEDGLTFVIEASPERVREEASATSSAPIVRLEIEPSSTPHVDVIPTQDRPSYMTREGYLRFCEVAGEIPRCADYRNGEE